MTQKNYRRKKDTAVSILFHQNYVPQISTLVIDEFCGSYATLADIKSTWRANIDYSKELADLLIIQTRTFIRMLDSRNSDSKNPMFLKTLTGLMADYLSAYFMNSDKFPTRNKAKEYLERVFYNENPYIINLLQESSMKRAWRQDKEAFIKSRQAPKHDKHRVKDAATKFAQINSTKKRLFDTDYIK